MKKEEIVGLAVRLFAVFLALYTLRSMGGLLLYFTSLYEGNNTFGILLAILSVVLPLIAAVLLWVFPLTVASRLIPSSKAKASRIPLGADSARVIAFSVLGLWVLTTAIPDLIFWITFVYRSDIISAGSYSLSPENIGNIVSTIVELVIGFGLLFGAKGLVGIIRKARVAGS